MLLIKTYLRLGNLYKKEVAMILTNTLFMMNLQLWLAVIVCHHLFSSTPIFGKFLR